MLGLNDVSRAGLLGGTALALIVAFGGRQAVALNECGAANPGDTVTCTPAGNDFPNGIQYKVNDLTIVIQDGVVIDTTTKANEPGGVVSGGDGNYGSLVIEAGTTGGSGVTIITDGDDASGIYARSKDGGVAITSYADISTGGDGSSGIVGISTSKAGAIAITSTGDITTAGDDAYGIRASGIAGVQVFSFGDIYTKGGDAIGIQAVSADNSALILGRGDVVTEGAAGKGLHVVGESGANINWRGNITTSGSGSVAVYAESDKGTAFINVDGQITTSGKYADGTVGVAEDDAEIEIIVIGGVTTSGYGARAIFASADKGEILVRSYAELSTSGDQAIVIGAFTDGAATVRNTGGIVSTGAGADGIVVEAGKDLLVVSNGNISILGSGDGIDVSSYAGDIDIRSTGDILTKGTESSGIWADATNGKIAILSIGNITTSGTDSAAIYADGEKSVRAVSFGAITTSGKFSTGIFVESDDEAAEVFAGGSIRTTGESASGIVAQGTTGVGVDSTADISTTGQGSLGITAGSYSGVVVIDSFGDITTTGKGAGAIFAESINEGVIITSGGSVHTSGAKSDGITAIADDVAAVFARDVIATGLDSSAIVVASDDALARVEINGDVQGGYGKAAGVSFVDGKQSTLDLFAGASLGAGSDIAIQQGDDNLTFNNRGTVTGYFDFAGGNDALINRVGGVIALRKLEDNDGDGDGDTEYVAVAKFGAGTDSFDNRGILTLGDAGNPGAWVTGNDLKHPGGGDSYIVKAGIEQGFITGLETFLHSGVITLSDGVAGDLLVITDQADGKTKGANVFKSNGGSLMLDVVLDDGSSKQSDVLILDKAETGTGGTRVIISNAGGTGGQTTGDGILVVNVRDKSSTDAFVSGGPAVSGAYQYDLHYQNAAKTDQNWYLRSSFFDGALEYPAIISGALVTWYSDLNGLHDRMGERRTQIEDSQTASLPTGTDIADSSAVRVNSGGDGGWLRVSGADMDIEQDGPADFDLDATRATAGFDLGFNSILDGQDWLVLGAMAGYGTSSVGFDGGSHADFDIATVGAYATYFRGPYYLDALVKLDWLDGDFSSENLSDDGDLELPVFGVSLETGYRFDLTPDGLYLQPQAQLSYAHVGDDSITDNSGSRIELQDADSLRGRLGARVGQELSTTAGAAAEPVTGNFYLEAAVNQEFLGETEARASGVLLEQDLPGTTFEIGGGIDIALPKDGLTFTVDADYTLGDEAEGISATGGFRINW